VFPLALTFDKIKKNYAWGKHNGVHTKLQVPTARYHRRRRHSCSRHPISEYRARQFKSTSHLTKFTCSKSQC